MENKTNCIIIHGCPSFKESLIDMSERTYYKQWIPWVCDQLIKKGIPAKIPLMPEPWAPDYKKFKEEFEKYDVNEDTVLIGHSCGCAFIVQWLGETKRKVKKIILVAPWKVATKKSASPEVMAIREKYYGFPIDETIKSRVGEIVMFTSDNEQPGGLESLNIYHEALGGKIITLPNKGHFIFEDMGTVEFPELLTEVI